MITLKGLKAKTPDTEIKRNKILKNVVTLYNNYYDIYKNDYDSKDDLSKAKKKRFDYKQFKNIGEENNKFKLAELLEWVKSKNDFNEAAKLIKDIKTIQIMSKQVLAIKKFLMIWIDW